MKWYLIVILVCISLMTNDADHLFICVLAILSIFFGELSVQIHCLF